MIDGPFCNGLEDLFIPSQASSRRLEFPLRLAKTQLLEILAKNNKAYKASNDKGANQVGVKLMEGQALFQLSFYSYDNLTDVNNEIVGQIPESTYFSTEEREERFSNDQLIDRVMVKEMGRGIRDIQISFENPIIVT